MKNDKVLCPYCGATMRLQMGDIGYYYECYECLSTSPNSGSEESAKRDAMERYIQRCTSKSEPLTLEQLEQRRGQPIWVEPVGDADWAAHWNILGDALDHGRLCKRPGPISERSVWVAYYLYLHKYGTAWVAYDFPPAEAK